MHTALILFLCLSRDLSFVWLSLSHNKTCKSVLTVANIKEQHGFNLGIYEATQYFIFIKSHGSNWTFTLEAEILNKKILQKHQNNIQQNLKAVIQIQLAKFISINNWNIYESKRSLLYFWCLFIILFHFKLYSMTLDNSRWLLITLDDS